MRENMSDREILEKYIDLSNSFKRWDRGRNQCNKFSFFIRPYHVREEDKKVIDKEMKHLCYLGILKEGFSLYSSPVMLISWKVMQDREC